MPLPIYLAMTAAEFRQNPTNSDEIAWMACHFSSYGTGIFNCPKQLPPGSMVILNDRTPVCGHDPVLVAAQLRELVDRLSCSRVLLDLQRPGEKLTERIVDAVLSALPCPVGVSECYGKELTCPVFLPPVPLLMSPQEYLSPWQGREVWLEIAPDASNYCLTELGCQQLPFSRVDKRIIHKEANLCCQYSMEIDEDSAVFCVERNRDNLHSICIAAEELGVSCLVGLFQELG